MEWFRAGPSWAASVRWGEKGEFVGFAGPDDDEEEKEDTRTGEEEALALAAEGRLLF